MEVSTAIPLSYVPLELNFPPVKVQFQLEKPVGTQPKFSSNGTQLGVPGIWNFGSAGGATTQGIKFCDTAGSRPRSLDGRLAEPVDRRVLPCPRCRAGPAVYTTRPSSHCRVECTIVDVRITGTSRRIPSRNLAG
jgi:hypothetical protein